MIHIARQRRLMCVISLLMLFSVTILHPASSSDNPWILLGFTKYRDAVFMNRNTTSSLHTVQVVARIAPFKKSRYLEKIKEDLKKLGKPVAEYHHSEILSEIDCNNNKIRYLQVNHYTRENIPLHSISDENATWKSIPSDSLWENMKRNVCTK